jgi:hypothetical protein
LFFVVVEDDGTVLGTTIVALAVGGGGIVDGEEDFQQGAEAHYPRIEMDLYHFRVARGACAHLFIDGGIDGAAGIAGNHT